MDTHNKGRSPSVWLPQGLVVGATLKSECPQAVEAFRGIPYALPPTGAHRSEGQSR